MRTSKLLPALAALLSLVLGACTQGSFPELWKKNKFDKLFAFEFCGGIAELVAGESDEQWGLFMLACTDRYTQKDSVQTSDLKQALDLQLAGERSMSPQAAAKNQAWQSGEMLMALYLASGKIKAGKFPSVVLAVPDTPALEGIFVRAAIFDPEKGQPKLVFKSLKATLRTVDQGSGSTTLGEGRAPFTKKDPFAIVPFDDVVPDENLEVVVDFTGGAVKDSMLLLTIGARDTAAVAKSRQSHPLIAPAAIGVHMAGAQAKVGELTEVGMVFVKAAGKVKSSDVPALSLDLAVDGAGPIDVNASVSVVTGDELEVPKRKYLPTSVTGKLFGFVDGEASLLGRSTQKIDKTGAAEFDFEDVDVRKAKQVRVVLEFSGKRVRNALIVGTASVQ